MVDAPLFVAKATLDGRPVDGREIIDAELARARHALAYLKSRIGNQLMRDLLADDVATMTAQVRDWVEASGGRWRTGVTEVAVPGPPAAAFHRWYDGAMKERREAVLRAGHPEHFVLSPGEEGIEVMENIGETELPWRVFYRSLPDTAFPLPWDDEWPIRFGAELIDDRGLRVGFTMHQARDTTEGLQLRLRTLLPEAAPPSLVDRHLRHFAIEFSNWSRIAWLEARAEAGASS